VLAAFIKSKCGLWSYKLNHSSHVNRRSYSTYQMLTAWNQSSREYSFIRVGRPRYAVAVFEDSVRGQPLLNTKRINIPSASRGNISGSSLWGLQRIPRMKRNGYWIRLRVEKPQFSAQFSCQCDRRHYQILLDWWDMRMMVKRGRLEEKTPGRKSQLTGASVWHN